MCLLTHVGQFDAFCRLHLFGSLGIRRGLLVSRDFCGSFVFLLGSRQNLFFAIPPVFSALGDVGAQFLSNLPPALRRQVLQAGHVVVDV